MLPTPTIPPASIRKLLTGPCRPTPRRSRSAPASGAPSGSRPRRRKRGSLSSLRVAATKATPNRRGSRTRRRAPRAGREERQPPAHAEWDDERPPPLAVDPQVLAPPPQRDDAAPGQRTQPPP